MQKNKKNILIVNNTGSYILKFRLELIKQLQSHGYNVVAAFPFDTSETQLNNLDVTCINLSLKSYSIGFLKELRTLLSIRKIVTEYNISIIFPFTIKPVLYSSYAAFFKHCLVISTITGMGKIYTDSSFKFRIISKLCDIAYRVGFKKNSYIVFQNPDDQKHFIDNKIIPNEKARLVNGSGINLSKHSFRQRKESDEISFIMVARILKEKGVEEYCLAAKRIVKKYNMRCAIAGGEVEGKKILIDGEPLTQFCTKHKIDYLGHCDNIPSLLDNYTLFVLPSYREGTPRSTLEALASGMPIITTDAPGTRETVINNSNGLLIPIKSDQALENAMEKIITNAEKIAAMSLKSRQMAEEKFDVEIVAQKYIEIIHNLK